MTPDELRALAPEVFEIAEDLRARGGDVRIRCIRTDVDLDGRGGTIVAGKMPQRDPGTFNVSGDALAALRAHNRALKVDEQRPWREFGYGKR